jgi:5'-3' exonuclease
MLLQVLFKLERNGTGDLVELKEVLKLLNLSADKSTDMCITAGCDYLENIKGVGINKAKKIVCENKAYLNVLQSLKFAPADYTKGVLNKLIWFSITKQSLIPVCVKLYR